MSRVESRLRTRGADERGAVMVLAALFMTVVVALAALAVDTGQLFERHRDLQGTADLAALDAVRTLPETAPADRYAVALAAAQTSALRNGWDPGAAGHSMALELGRVDPATRAYTAVTDPADANAVEIRASTDVDRFFMPGEGYSNVRAVATLEEAAGFGAGSFLASASISEPALDAVFGNAFGGSLTLVGYQGLAAAHLTLEELFDTSLGTGLGSPTELAHAEVVAADFIRAMATVMEQQGDTASATALNGLAATMDQSTTIDLGDLFDVQQGGDEAAASSQLNVYQLVTATAHLVNGSSFISIPTATVSIPGVTATTLSVQVVQGTVYTFGTVGAELHTSQAVVRVTPTVHIGVSVPLLTDASVRGTVPLEFETAGATVTLTDVECDANQQPGAELTLQPEPVDTSALADLGIWARVLLSTVQVFDLEADAAAVSAGTPSTHWFDDPDDLGSWQRGGSTTLGLDTLLSWNVTKAQILVNLGPTAATLTAATLDAITPVLAGIDTLVVSPVAQTLGIHLGGADMTVTQTDCGLPLLVG